MRNCDEGKLSFTKPEIFKIYIAYLIDFKDVSIEEGSSMLHNGLKAFTEGKKFTISNTCNTPHNKLYIPLPEEGNSK